MTCVSVIFLTYIVLFSAILMSLGLLSIAAGLLIIAIAAAVVAIVWMWRIIYPWLVRMGRWAAQLRNIIFLFALIGGLFLLWYLLNQAGVNISPVVLWILLGLGVIALFLLLLALVVWLVRLWRYTWPIGRNFFWDIGFRTVALFWKILVGIPLGITWFLYHPPLRWLIAALLFYLKGISAAAAWLLYNPPLRGITIVILFFTRLIGRIIAWLLYNPPIRWVIEFGLFILRLIARFTSNIIYGLVSWWPVSGVKGTLRKGLTAESKSYQDYKYA